MARGYLEAARRPEHAGQEHAHGRDDERDDPGPDVLRAEDRAERRADSDDPRRRDEAHGERLDPQPRRPVRQERAALVTSFAPGLHRWRGRRRLELAPGLVLVGHAADSRPVTGLGAALAGTQPLIREAPHYELLDPRINNHKGDTDDRAQSHYGPLDIR